jgi:cytochrome c1
MIGGNVSRNRWIGVAVVAPLAIALATAGGLLAAHARAATDGAQAAPTVYTISATLKGARGKGTLTGRLSTITSTSGTFTWKLKFSGLGARATGAQLRVGTKILARLCGPCASGVHKSLILHGQAYATVKKHKAVVTVATKAHPTGQIKGTLKLKLVMKGAGGGASGGGSGTVAVTPSAIAAGKKYSAQFSCEGCHTISGAKSTGPTWKGLAGSKVHQTDGTTVTATDAYLIRVITDPSTLKVEGYDSGVMSEVIAPGTVSNTQARAIVAYIKSLK